MATKIVMLPILAIVVGLLILFGQRPDVVILAFTQTSDWIFSKMVSPQPVYYVEDLVGKDPEVIYQKDCIHQGYQIDRCQLYVYRLAVYFAETEKPEMKKLKWWYWKD